MEQVERDHIVKETVFNAPIARVWKAISDEKEISAWFLQADFKAEVGYEYTFTHKDTRIIGKVLEVNPVYLLTYTWEVEGTEVATTVQWKLSETEAGTAVVIEHTGISKYPSEDLVAKFFENYSNGWINCIEQLEKHLA